MFSATLCVVAFARKVDALADLLLLLTDHLVISWPRHWLQMS